MSHPASISPRSARPRALIQHQSAALTAYRAAAAVATPQVAPGRVRVLAHQDEDQALGGQVALARYIARAVWTRRGAPARTVGLVLGDPPELPLWGTGAYAPPVQTVYVDPVRCVDVAGPDAADVLAATLAHEFTHAAQHAASDAAGVVFDRNTTDPAYDHATDPDEIDAMQEEMALVVALTGDFLDGVLDQPAQVVRFEDGPTVPLALVRAYLELLPARARWCFRRLQTAYAGRTANPDRVWPATIEEAVAQHEARHALVEAS